MYSQKAFEILDSSINSVVFIDEKAKEFYSGEPINNDIPEEKLSVDLFDKFKEKGKTIAIHKFEPDNFNNPNTVDYLFKGRDLILLDWELAEHAGYEHSLKLLNKAVNTPNINFCCIYSQTENFNDIPLFLDSYFSGLSKEDFVKIKEFYSHIEKQEIEHILGKLQEIDTFFEENQIEIENFPIEQLRNKSKQLILRYIYISIADEKFYIPNDESNKHEVINNGSDSFVINNTFVLALKKDFENDSDYDKLLGRISEAVIKNESSFFQLLGLEMQSVFNSNERFIDETILKSSTEALFQFRNHLGDDKIFGTIIKKLLIEQATLKLRTAKLKLLETDFLDKKSEELKGTDPSINDLFQLNVFYNSVSVKGLNSESVPNLNFGDVFKGNDENYYLCITALCDCYYPNKIDGNFYFVKGTLFENVELALELGDTAFISFLPDNKAVYWGDLEKPRKYNKIKNLNLSGSEDNIEKLKNDIELLHNRINKLTENQDSYKSFLYKPYYVKPKVFNVEDNKINNNKIRIWDITNKYTKEEFDQKLNYVDVEYITTLRNDYTQRIANHAFGHPTRVGVDFVKI